MKKLINKNIDIKYLINIIYNIFCFENKFIKKLYFIKKNCIIIIKTIRKIIDYTNCILSKKNINEVLNV